MAYVVGRDLLWRSKRLLCGQLKLGDTLKRRKHNTMRDGRQRLQQQKESEPCRGRNVPSVAQSLVSVVLRRIGCHTGRMLS